MIEAELNQAAALPAQQAAAANQTPASAPGPSAQTSTADPKTDPDYGACEKASGDSSIAACDRAISSGKFAGSDLGALYRYRGYAKSNAETPDTDAAIADFGEAVRLEPNSFVPFVLRAIVYAGKGEPELAIKDYDRAIELNPRADFYNNRGNALRKTRAFDLAIADLDQAIKLEPNYSSAYWTRGLIYRDKGDKEKAADDYKKALSLNPSEDAKKEIEALLKEVTPEDASQPTTSSQATPQQQAGAGNSGNATDDTANGKEPEPTQGSKVLKSTEEILADPDFKACQALGSSKVANCDRAIASGKFAGPALALIYSNRGFGKSSAHNEDGALEDFNKAIEIDPDIAVSYNNRGQIYLNRKEYDRAIADFSKSIELNAHPVPFESRGRAYWWKGDLEHAAADFEKSLSLNPPPELKDRMEKDLKQIKAGVKLVPSSEPAQKQGSADTGKGKEPDPAPSSKVLKSPEEVFADPDFKACKAFGSSQVANCDRAIASGKFEGQPLATLYNNRGQARGLNHDDDAALEDFNKSIELYPDAAAPYNNRGTIFSERGEYDRAIADFDKAIELNGTQPIIFHGRGLAYWRKGDLERAAADYKKALSLNPPPQRKENWEQDLKEIEAGAKPTPGAEPAQKQGSADTPVDDKNSALSGVREGGSGDTSGLPSTTGPTEGQGSSLTLLPKEDQSSPPAQEQSVAMKAQPAKSGPWAAIAADGSGGWGYAVGQPSRDEARNAALKDCGGSGCKILDALKFRCIAYVESRQGGYWYFAWIGPNESNVQSKALNGCDKAAPAGSCKLVKSICAPAPGSASQASADPSASQASGDPKKDADYCMNTFGQDAMPACDRAIASGHFGKLDLGTLHNQRGVLHMMKLRDDDAIAEFSEAIRLDDSLAKYFNHRGYAYFAKGDYDKAIADFDQAIKRAPKSASGYKGRAQSYFKKGLPGPARDDYNKALSLNPDADERKEIEETLKELGPDPRKMKMQ